LIELKQSFIRFHWILFGQFGIDIRTLFRSLRRLPNYVCDWTIFRKNYTDKMTLIPHLHDFYEEGGATNSEYFGKTY